MGMYDNVDYECVCPVCQSKVDGFQTKSKDCLLDTYPPSEVSNFYSSCGKCGCWIEFSEHPIPKTNFTRTVSGKGRSGVLHEHTKDVNIKDKLESDSD